MSRQTASTNRLEVMSFWATDVATDVLTNSTDECTLVDGWIGLKIDGWIGLTAVEWVNP
jgi:hypothetical protein